MSSFLSRFAGLFLVTFAFALHTSSAEAKLLLYIDDDSTSGIDVVLMDGKSKGYQITSADTDFQQLWGKFITADDTGVADSIGVDSAGVEDINSVLSVGGNYSIASTNLTAYSSYVSGGPNPNDNDNPGGGNRLDLKVIIEGLSNAGANLSLVATRTVEFSGPVWFYNYFGSGNAVAPGVNPAPEDNEAILNRVYMAGAVSNSGDFSFTGNGVFGGNPISIDADSGLFALGSGNVFLDGSIGGSLTLSSLLNVELNEGEKVDFQSTEFAVVPEPASMALWLLVAGGGAAASSRRRRAASV